MTGIATRLADWLRRRRFLRRRRATTEAELRAAFADTAPELVDAFRRLEERVAGTGFDAAVAAHDQLTSFRDELKTTLRDSLQQLAAKSQGALTEIAERAEAQRAEIAGLRAVYAAQQERLRQLEDGQEWALIKQFCFRFFRILDGLAGRAATPDDPVRVVYDEILFALEASGVEQFSPEPGSPFAGNEKRLKVVGKADTDQPQRAGLVAGVRMPGYLLAQDGRPDRVLRPAEVVIYQVTELEEVGV